MLLDSFPGWLDRMGRPLGRPIFITVALLVWAIPSNGEIHPLVRGVVVEGAPQGQDGSDYFGAAEDNVDPHSDSPAGLGLLRFYGCITCHDLALPPYRRRWGPDLDTVGSKTGWDWIDRFLERPGAVQPGGKMPRVPLTDEERSHLVAFLGGLTVGLDSGELGEVESGKRLFEMNECLRCHTKDGVGAKKAPILDNVGGKIQRDWLVAYLQGPSRLTPNTTMPLFDLTTSQAQDITAFLVQGASIPSVDPPPNAGSKKEGARLFAQKGCAHCHRVGSLTKRIDLPPTDGADAFLAAHETREPIIRIPESQQRAMTEAVLDPYSAMADVTTDDFLVAFWRTPIPLQGSAPAAHDSSAAVLTPARCGACHSKQYEQWHASLHGAAMGPGVMGQLHDRAYSGPEFTAGCRACHAPNAEQAPMLPTEKDYEVNYSYDEQLADDGITCLACHVRQHARFGPSASEQPPISVWLGPGHGGGHETPAHSSSSFCSACHQFADTGGRINGKLLQDTYAEWEASPQAQEGLTCQACHMPARAHTWTGIHDVSMVKKAVRVEAKTKWLITGEVVADITIDNIDAGHHLPTYVTPKLFVVARLLDEAGDYIGGSAETRAIGRDVVLGSEQQEELYDTRIPAGGRWRWRYRKDKPGAHSLSLAVTVHPDHFYQRFFSTYDRSGLSDVAEALIDSAQARTERSPFTIYDVNHHLPSP
jgi:cytochrome c2